jgi:hypothetical protein
LPRLMTGADAQAPQRTMLNVKAIFVLAGLGSGMPPNTSTVT